MLEYLPDPTKADRPSDPAMVQFVGGPRDGERERRTDMADRIDAAGGSYRRSVRCEDDGLLRYVFDADPDEIAHQRSIRPC